MGLEQHAKEAQAAKLAVDQPDNTLLAELSDSLYGHNARASYFVSRLKDLVFRLLGSPLGGDEGADKAESGSDLARLQDADRELGATLDEIEGLISELERL